MLRLRRPVCATISTEAAFRIIDVNRMVKAGSVMEPCSVTLCSPTQSVLEGEKLPENLTGSPTFIVARALNSDEFGSMSVWSPRSETLLFQVETWTFGAREMLMTPLPSPFEVSLVILPTQSD